MIPLLVTGSLVAMSALCAMLARALRERDQARIALGIARMELLDVRCRLADTHRRVVELERAQDKGVVVPVSRDERDAVTLMLASADMANRMRVGHPMAGGDL